MQLVGANQLRELEKSISSGKKDSVLGFLRIGQALSKIKELDLWRFSEAESFSSYMEKVQGIKRSWGYALLGVAETFGPMLDLTSGGSSLSVNPDTPDITRLVRLLPHITEENKEELYHLATNTPAKAFEDSMRNLKGKVATDDPHECIWEPIPYLQCSVCGQKRRLE
jgi:hypothetical protein